MQVRCSTTTAPQYTNLPRSGNEIVVDKAYLCERGSGEDLSVCLRLNLSPRPKVRGSTHECCSISQLARYLLRRPFVHAYNMKPTNVNFFVAQKCYVTVTGEWKRSARVFISGGR